MFESILPLTAPGVAWALFWVVVAIVGVFAGLLTLLTVSLLLWRLYGKLTFVEEAYPVWSDVQTRVALVTGVAKKGIGFECAKQLAEAGCKKVFVTARNEGRGKETVELLKKAVPAGVFELLLVDLASLDRIEKFVKTIEKKTDRLDIVVHNAGMICPSYQTTQDGWEMQFGTNHLAEFHLTNLLLPLLTSPRELPARVVVVTSSAGREQGLVGTSEKYPMTKDTLNSKAMAPGGGTPYSQLVVYGNSKLCTQYFCVGFSDRIEKAGLQNKITTAQIHPGAVMGTQLNRDSDGLWGLIARTSALLPSQSPAEAAKNEVRAALDPTLKCGTMIAPWNGYFGPPTIIPRDADRTPWNSFFAKGSAEEVAHTCDTLWQLSEEMTGRKFSLGKNAK